MRDLAASESRWARQSVDSAMRRMAMLLASAVLLMAAADLFADGVSEGITRKPLLAASLTVATALWVRCIVHPRGTSGYLILGLIQFSAVSGAATSLVEFSDGGSALDWAPMLLVLVAGLLLPFRATVLVTVTTAIGTVLIILRLMTEGGAPLGDCLVAALYRALYVLCDGWATGGMAFALRRMADRTDQTEADAERQQVIAAELQSAEETAAEFARILHDSAVNTFAAIASGRLASDPATVKSRCNEDIKTLRGLLLQGETTSSLDGRIAWKALENEGIRLSIAGATKASISETLATLPANVAHAFVASMAEAVRNIAKHAGVDDAVITVRRGAALEIIVSDKGHGFDGAVPAGRGLQRSIIDRCVAVGIDAAITSSAGIGTTVRLSYTPPSSIAAEEESERENRVFLTESVWLCVRMLTSALLTLCLGLTVLDATIGLSLSALAALVLIAGTSLLVFWRCRDLLNMPLWLITLMLALIPAIFFAPGWDRTGCDRAGASAWGVDGCVLGILTLVMLAQRWVLPVAIAVYIASTVVWLTTIPGGCGTTVPTSAIFDVVIFMGMWLMRRKLWSLTARASLESKKATQARMKVAATEAASRVRGLREAQVLRSSLQLLSQIADGSVSPHDHGLRRRCQSEESYLRELTLLDPALTNVGGWLAGALATAHSRGASLRIRSVAADMASPEDAASVGAFLLDVIRVLPIDAAVSFSISHGAGGAALVSVVGDIAPLRTALNAQPHVANSRWTMRYAELDEEALVELRMSSIGDRGAGPALHIAG